MALKAHLEFSQSAEAAQLEGRRQPRRSLRLETSGVVPGGLEANVTVHNISAAGLLLETELPLSVGEMLAIDLPQVGPVGAEIVWESGDLFGCAFQQALGEAALAAAELRGDLSGVGEVQPAGFAMALGDPLGTRLNRLRRERGLTLAQVASALDVSKPTVWAWEKGKAKPLAERIEAIAEVLGVSASELSASSKSGEGAAIAEECRQKLAAAYGVDARSIRIMIEM